MQEKLTANHIFDHEIPRILSEKPEIAKRINAVLGIELIGENGGYWTLDLTNNPGIERGRTKEPKCMISAHVEDFEALLAGGSIRTALDAFKKKRIQASGHLPTILKLEFLLTSLVKRAQ
ncbi:MAG: SCP2 sterol-binding domain-containing protein [Actinobacteria bacterium]|nr:SCP2 sterol-binding domain-containing protein [Actinomycetota bacterium]